MSAKRRGRPATGPEVSEGEARFFRDLSQEALADLLGTTRHQVRKARRKLREGR